MAVTFEDDVETAAPLRCPQCGVEAQTPAGLASHTRSRHPETVDVPAPVPDDVPAEAEKPTGFLGKWFKRTPAPAKPQAAARPRRRTKRVPGVDVLAFPFEHGARMLAGTKPCTANVLTWESTWGAYVLDEALAGTLPDRLFVQPLARNYRRVAMVESVVGPIALAFAMESRPQLIPHLMPEMRRAVRGAAPFMLRAMAKKRVEDAEIEEAFRAAYPDMDDENMTADDMIDSLLAGVFAPLQAQAQEVHDDVSVPA